MIFFSALFFWFLFGLASAMIASGKGRSGCLWFALGVFLGPFGVLFAFVAGDVRPRWVAPLGARPPLASGLSPAEWGRRCPRCQAEHGAEVSFCSACGSDLRAVPLTRRATN